MNKVHKCNLMEKAEVRVEIDEDEALLNLNNVASGIGTRFRRKPLP
jgi:hypothetical protein